MQTVKTRSACVLGVLVLIPLLVAGQMSSNIRRYAGNIAEAKTLTESYVGIAKDHLDLKSDAYITAQKKYAEAYSKYSAWLTELELAVQQGSDRHLDEDTGFLTRGKEAGDAAASFVNYVDEQTKHSKAVVTILTDIASSALKIWQGVKDQKAKERQSVVSYLDTHGKWKSWTELTSVPSKQ